MSRRVGLRLVAARAVDEVQEGLAGGEATQILDDDLGPQPVPERVKPTDVGEDHDPPRDTP